MTPENEIARLMKMIEKLESKRDIADTQLSRTSNSDEQRRIEEKIQTLSEEIIIKSKLLYQLRTTKQEGKFLCPFPFFLDNIPLPHSQTYFDNLLFNLSFDRFSSV